MNPPIHSFFLPSLWEIPGFERSLCLSKSLISSTPPSKRRRRHQCRPQRVFVVTMPPSTRLRRHQCRIQRCHRCHASLHYAIVHAIEQTRCMNEELGRYLKSMGPEKIVDLLKGDLKAPSSWKILQELSDQRDRDDGAEKEFFLVGEENQELSDQRDRDDGAEKESILVDEENQSDAKKVEETKAPVRKSTRLLSKPKVEPEEPNKLKGNACS